MDKVQHIKENWFKDHIATLKQHGALQVLDWREPGTSFYYCRYVFDGCNMYISGDIGEAVFELTWKANIHSFNDLSLGYFHSKLSAYSEDKYDFNSDIAVRRLREWLIELKAEERKYDHEEMKELFELCRGCDSRDEWAHIINNHSDFIEKLDQDYWEWMYKAGNEIPWRVYGYLVGLQMASEQLKQTQQEAV